MNILLSDTPDDETMQGTVGSMRIDAVIERECENCKGGIRIQPTMMGLTMC